MQLRDQGGEERRDGRVRKARDVGQRVKDIAVPYLHQKKDVRHTCLKRDEGIYRMQLRFLASKRYRKVVTAFREPGRMERLVNIAEEVDDPLKCERARQIRASRKGTRLDLIYTAGEDFCLVCDSANDAASFCAVPVVVHITICWRLEDRQVKDDVRC